VTHEPDIVQYCSRVVSFRDGLVQSDDAVTDRKVAHTETAPAPEITRTAAHESEGADDSHHNGMAMIGGGRANQHR